MRSRVIISEKESKVEMKSILMTGKEGQVVSYIHS